MLDKKTYVV